MENFCLLVTDGGGRVTAQVGSLSPDGTGRPGSSRDVRGLGWQKALEGPIGKESLPEELPSEPTSLETTSADGRCVRLWMAPLPSDSGGGNILLLHSGRKTIDLRAQRFSTLGMLAAGAAHEMNNLLTLASGWLELVLGDESAQGWHSDSLRKVEEALQHLSGLSKTLLDFARPQTGQVGRVDLNGLVRRVVELVDYQIEKDNTKLTVELSEVAPLVEGREDELSQTLLNLVMNGCQAMPDGGRLQIFTRCEGEWAVLGVRDTGCGISPEIQKRVFDPFFTTRRREGGTGLGLAVCKRIVEKHGGELALESEPGAGTTVTLRIAAVGEGVLLVGD